MVVDVDTAVVWDEAAAQLLDRDLDRLPWPDRGVEQLDVSCAAVAANNLAYLVRI